MQNKVIKITLPGGLLGLFFGNARETLERQIQKENESGWRVIQVENHLIKNLLNYTIDLIILLLTLLVYTRGSEYYIKLERESRPSSDISDEFFESGKITLDDLKKKFIELPTLQKSAVIVVPILYILLAFYTFVPPYLAKMKEEKIASVVNAVKSQEPQKIDVPSLGKTVNNAKFQDNLSNDTYNGRYSVTLEEGDHVTETVLYIESLNEDELQVLIESRTYGFDGEGNSYSEETLGTLKNPEIMGNVLTSETEKARFAMLNVRDRYGRLFPKLGLIFNGVFYERIGDLPESSPVAGSKRQKSDPLPATVPPEQPQQPAPPQAQPTPAPSTGGSSIGVLTGEGVRLRSSMDKTSKTNIIDKFAKGTQVQILENHGEWLRVRVNGKEGFMAAQFVQPQ